MSEPDTPLLSGLRLDRISTHMTTLQDAERFVMRYGRAIRGYVTAILRDPAILILDEATSAVDNETEAAIQRSLASVTKGRTSIIIAHRLSTVRDAHKIWVLEAGRVSEAGTHDELLQTGGLYSALWRVQTGGH